MEIGRTYKKYNCHVIVYKDLLNQEKQLQRNSHIWAYRNKIMCEQRDLAIKENELKRQEKLKKLGINEFGISITLMKGRVIGNQIIFEPNY